MKSLRIVEQVSINKMIAEFLRNNLHQIKKEDVTNFKILEQPDIKDIKENKLRWNLFSDKFWLFVRFLPQCDWFECEITLPESFKNIRIIDEESWKNNLFSGEHLVENINIEKFEEDNHFLKINQFFQNNIEKFINEKYIIGIEKYDNEKVTIIDGNHRFSALYWAYINNRIKDFKLKMIIGFTYGKCRWIGDEVNWIERPSKTNERRYILNIW